MVVEDDEPTMSLAESLLPAEFITLDSCPAGTLLLCCCDMYGRICDCDCAGLVIDAW